MGNIHVKSYAIWTSGLGGDVIFKKKKFTDQGMTDRRRMKTDHNSSL